MKRKTIELLGYTAYLDIDDQITAGFLDAESLAETLTIVTQETETVDGYTIPEETDVDSARWSEFWNALVGWVAYETGLPVAELQEAQHPDVWEPFLQYRPETTKGLAC